MTGKNVVRIIVGLIIAGALLSVMFSYQIRHNELGVVETLGRLAAEPTGPGLHWRLPYPIQKVTRYERQTQYFEGEYTQLQTQDQRNVLVGLYVCWHVGDPIKYRKRLGSDMSRTGDLGKGEAVLRPLVRSAKGNVIGLVKMESFASLRSGGDRLAAIETQILQQVQAEAREVYGIEVQRIGIERTSLPEDVTAVVMENERIRRTRDAEDARSQGLAQAKAIVSEAEAIRDQIIAFANLQAAEIRNRGEARAKKYYDQYENEDYAMFLRRLDYLRKTLAVQSLFVLDGSGAAPYGDISHGWFKDPPTPETLNAGSQDETR
ncbi:MAG: hypothetical protein E4H23_08975 [Chrysiogenales bacterium]|nr:MAG: hypothetical protein E4H23_08975 [Chrysiogenales bacterium]